MPSSRSSSLQPRRTPPAPVPVDLGRVTRVGIVVWGVALVVTLVLAATGTIAWEPVWVCVVGIVLGFAGADWARRHPPTPPAGPAESPAPSASPTE